MTTKAWVVDSGDFSINRSQMQWVYRLTDPGRILDVSFGDIFIFAYNLDVSLPILLNVNHDTGVVLGMWEMLGANQSLYDGYPFMTGFGTPFTEWEGKFYAHSSFYQKSLTNPTYPTEEIDPPLDETQIVDPDTGNLAVIVRCYVFDPATFAGWSVNQYPLLDAPALDIQRYIDENTENPDWGRVGYSPYASTVVSAGGWAFLVVDQSSLGANPELASNVPADAGTYVFARRIDDFLSPWQQLAFRPSVPFATAFVDPDPPAYIYTANETTRAFVTASGRIVFTTVGFVPSVIDGSEATIILYSDDDGVTWVDTPYPFSYGAVFDDRWTKMARDATYNYAPYRVDVSGESTPPFTNVTVARSTDGVAWDAIPMRAAVDGHLIADNLQMFVRDDGVVVLAGIPNATPTLFAAAGTHLYVGPLAKGTTAWNDFVFVDVPEALSSWGAKLRLTNFYWDSEHAYWVCVGSAGRFTPPSREAYAVILNDDLTFVKMIQLPTHSVLDGQPSFQPISLLVYPSEQQDHADAYGLA